MTALAERVPARSSPWRRRQRSKPLIAALVTATVATAGILGHEAVRMREAVDRERSSLRNAQTVEAAARRALLGVREATGAAAETRRTTTASDRRRVAERSQAHAALMRIEQRIGLIDQELTSTRAAQVEIAQYSAARDACINGVRAATTALQRGDTPAAVAALRAADTACSAALAAATGARFPYDFPDPSVLEVDAHYYAYSTNSGTGNIQVLVSRDLVRWTIAGDALAALPSWASPGATWAPAVMRRASGFIAYYTTREIVSGRQCISAAVAFSPLGPFVDVSKKPLVCQAGGSIDPSPFVDETGNTRLLWKSEATGTDPPTIWSQPLNDDGLGLAGVAVALLTPLPSWEHGVVEAPSMIRIAGHEYLFYSGGFWTTAGYAEGAASCDGPGGPCQRVVPDPVLASAGRLAGPGGGAAFTTPTGDVWLAFHAFTRPNVGYPNSRTLHLASVRVVAGIPVVTPQ